MLHYLPMPRPDELLYSVFARYAVHMGIISPKQCLDDLFGCRTVVATVDLPSHLDAFLANAGHLWDISPDDLIYQHTLLPLYAPFVPDERRLSAISHMRSDAGGALHVQMGVSASTVSTPNHLQFCPACLQDQQRHCGEYFWRRSWQVTGAKACSLHGSLSDSCVRFRHQERHRFVAATPTNCVTSLAADPEAKASAIDRALGDLIVQLLEMPALPSPTYHQWSKFYHELAVDLDYTHGAHVHHRGLLNEFQHIWADGSIDAAGPASNWLTSLFRKHRKSFSYLQHLATWAAFLPELSVGDIFQRISDHPRQQCVPTNLVRPSCDTDDFRKYRSLWSHALGYFDRQGTKWIRANVSGMAAVYAWLYRHDRSWLLKMNKEHRVARPTASGRANWQARDKALSHKLRLIANDCDATSAWRTKTWYINQLPHHASVAKNLGHLPLLSALLEEISESVAQYQIRRCKYVFENLNRSGGLVATWRIERAAGLSPRTIRPETRLYIEEIVENSSGKRDNSKHTQSV